MVDEYAEEVFANSKIRDEDEEFIAFNSEQIKSADPVTYDDNGDIIPLSKRFDMDNEDIRFSQRGISVDNQNQITDNKIKNFGGISNAGENTELLEQGAISAISGDYDPVWQQSESAKKIFGYLGVVSEYKTNNEKNIGRIDSGWIAQSSYTQHIEKGFEAGILRTLRGVKLNGNDTIGRKLTKAQLSKLRNTIYQARPDFSDILFDEFDGEVTDNDARLITEYIDGNTDTISHIL